MQAIYEKNILGQGGDIAMVDKSVKLVGGFFGARCEFVIKVIIIQPDAQLGINNPVTSIRIEYRPLMDKKIKGWDGCAVNGIISIPDDSQGAKRIVQQEINATNPFKFSVLDFTDISESDVDVARELTRNLIGCIEVVVEDMRNDIFNGFANSFSDRATAHVSRQYDKKTKENVESILSDINWPFLLDGSGFGADHVESIEYMANNNKPRCLAFDLDEDMGNLLDVTRMQQNADQFIKELLHEQDLIINQIMREGQAKKRREGTKRALVLMRRLCGDELTDQFIENKQMVIEQDGWTFILKADFMMACISPDKKKATLCIHTRNLCCHPVDEVIIAYLNIRNDYKGYLKTAILRGHDPGFKKPKL